MEATQFNKEDAYQFLERAENVPLFLLSSKANKTSETMGILLIMN